MRNFVAPGQYTSVLESAVSRCVDEIRRDIYNREHGLPPIIPDMLLDRLYAGDVAATVGGATLLEYVARAIGEDAQQRRRRKRPA